MRVGIDEVGRGCWAGPLCVAAVCLTAPIAGLTDSKLLRPAQRQKLAAQIRRHAHIGIAWMSPGYIDSVGLGEALRQAFVLAISQIQHYNEVILDGSVNYLPDHHTPVTVLPKADLLIPEVSAASIVAKVARDNYMARMHAIYPEYAFNEHVGYGTRKHQAALQKHGITILHRRSFKPVALMMKELP